MARAQAQQTGYRHFNFKAAVAPTTDVAVARAVRHAAGADAFVWADANQGLQLPDARRVIDAFASAGVDVLEQPLAAAGASGPRCSRSRPPSRIEFDGAVHAGSEPGIGVVPDAAAPAELHAEQHTARALQGLKRQGLDSSSVAL